MVMKIMLLQKRLSKTLFALFFLFVSASVMAETKWEVAALFFGQYEDSSFQESIENNLTEISKIPASKFLKIKTFRAGANQKLDTFLSKAFNDPDSKKMLIFYGHGVGPSGLKDLNTVALKKSLSALKTKIDVMWFDACFLANIEFLFEMRSFSTYSIASEEAEFTSGLPFESLIELPIQNSSKDAAVFLAKSFIDSYSYLKSGTQTHAVNTSSATISVVENAKLQNFAKKLKSIAKIIKSLPAETQSSLKNKLVKKFSMEKPDLIDLGHLLIELRLITKDRATDDEITGLIRQLNIDSVKKLKSNPRIKINSPAPNAVMVYGFNYWENGFEKEFLSNELFSLTLKQDKFLEGPHNQKWPAKTLKGSFTIVTPFAPGIKSFEYYFLDANGSSVLTSPVSISRTHDIVETNGETLVYSAYTQRVGKLAERYTGINITIFNSAPSMDYFESEFNQLTRWLSL